MSEHDVRDGFRSKPESEWTNTDRADWIERVYPPSSDVKREFDRVESATRAKVEAECAQRTAEAVEAARKDEREKTLAEIERTYLVADLNSDALLELIARLRGEVSRD